MCQPWQRPFSTSSIPPSRPGSRAPSPRRPRRRSQAWPAIQSGRHVLIAAPTGSGKTLAAFLAAIDALVRAGVRRRVARRDARRLRLAAEGAVERHPAESRECRWPASAQSSQRLGPARCRDPHRRCAPATRRRPSATRMRRHAAAHPRHDAGVAVHPARPSVRAARCWRRRAPSSSTRSTRWRRTSAARTWRCRSSGSRHLAGARADAHRPVGDAEADRRGRALSGRRPQRRGRAGPACAIVDTGHVRQRDLAHRSAAGRRSKR